MRLHIVYGEHDPVYPDFAAAIEMDTWRWMAESPQVEITVAPGSGHNLFVTLAGQDIGMQEVRRWARLMIEDAH